MSERKNAFIFRRIVVASLCFFLPVIFLYTLFFFSVRQTIREELTSAVNTQLNFYQSQLENEVSRIQLNMYNCLSDKDIGAMSVYPEFLGQVSHLESVRRIQDRMLSLLNSSSYIEDAFVLIPQDQRKISFSGLEKYEQEEFEDLDSLGTKNIGVVSSYKDEILLCSSYPYISAGDDNTRSSLFLIVVELSRQQLSNVLFTMRSQDQRSEMIFFQDEGSLQLSTGDDLPDFTLSDYEASSISIRTTKGSYLLVYTHVASFDAILCEIIPENLIFYEINFLLFFVILLSITSIIIMLIYIVYLYRLIHKPLNILIHSFDEMGSGKTGVSIHYDLKDEFAYIYNRFNDIATRLDHMIQQVYIQKIFMQKAQLKQLQSQINPHFLYNSFFILGTLARIGDNITLEKFTNQLGEYFHFITRNTSDEVLLMEEVRHAKTYTDIQAQRFSNRIGIVFEEFPAAFNEWYVPRLILQPIIENAFVYGVEKMPKDGRVEIRFSGKGNELIVSVENNGYSGDAGEIEAMKQKIQSNDTELEVTGLVNIHRRLVLRFGQKSGLTVRRLQNGNFYVEIKIVRKDIQYDSNADL